MEPLIVGRLGSGFRRILISLGQVSAGGAELTLSPRGMEAVEEVLGPRASLEVGELPGARESVRLAWGHCNGRKLGIGLKGPISIPFNRRGIYVSKLRGQIDWVNGQVRPKRGARFGELLAIYEAELNELSRQ
ncbi:MAG: hypothetical protein DCC75_04685 [Proteobacteria bacterium]|nr:MAG: hypothetical protein DCC75_04685 [Pseudomonadota bacterium]